MPYGRSSHLDFKTQVGLSERKARGGNEYSPKANPRKLGLFLKLIALIFPVN
jgi:hypothetical protein